MTTRPLILCLGLLACDTPASEGTCGSPITDDPYHLIVGASILEVDESVGSAAVTSTRSIDCAAFTVTRVDSDWQTSGTSPASVAVSPGSYVVELDWFDEEGRCAYTSDPVLVVVEEVARTLEVPMCVDMSGEWQCQDDETTWQAQAEMINGCSLTIDGIDGEHWINGHMIDDDHVTGVIASDGEALSAMVGDRSISCLRAD